jgi:hypothetical protein
VKQQEENDSMTDSKVEQVARAIAVAEGGRMAVRHRGQTLTVAALAGFGWKMDDPASERYADVHWKMYLTAAEMAIAALREPTEEMHHAARDWSREKYGKPIGSEASDGCWKSMIDAALK